MILGSKVKVKFGLQTFYRFLTITPFHFDLKMMVLHTCVDHDPMRTSIEFGVKRSKVMVKLTSIFLPFAR